MTDISVAQMNMAQKLELSWRCDGDQKVGEELDRAFRRRSPHTYLIRPTGAGFEAKLFKVVQPDRSYEEEVWHEDAEGRTRVVSETRPFMAKHWLLDAFGREGFVWQFSGSAGREVSDNPGEFAWGLTIPARELGRLVVVEKNPLRQVVSTFVGAQLSEGRAVQ